MFDSYKNDHQLFFTLLTLRDSNATQICAGLLKNQDQIFSAVSVCMCVCVFLYSCKWRLFFSFHTMIHYWNVLFPCKWNWMPFYKWSIYTGQTFFTCITLSFFLLVPLLPTPFLCHLHWRARVLTFNFLYLNVDFWHF